VTRFTVGLPIRRMDDEGAFGDPGAIRDLVLVAEERGFWGLTAPDHIVSPNVWARAGGGEQWYDPFVLLGFAAGLTTRLRLITHIIVLPYRAPFEVAKAIGSLDHISNGRAVMGVASGYLKEEFEILGVPYSERGERTDEYLRIIAACWTDGDIEYEGTFFSISDARMGPRPVQTPRPPIWIGGNSLRAVRRAVELGDCWAPFDVTDERVSEASAYAGKLGRRVELALPLGRVQKETPRSGRGLWGDAVAPRVRALLDLGADYVKGGFGGRTPAEWAANLEWFAAEVMPSFA
jgi:probable F420-dependent oxidoreductase